MKVINDKEFIDVPDSLNCDDTIIYQNTIYLICSKTWDHDNKEFYCKVVIYEETDTNIVDLLRLIYDSQYFETSGFNTNNVNNHPRLFILLTILTVILGSDYMRTMGSKYKYNVISMWNQQKILFENIIDDDPKIACSDLNKINKSVIALLKINKIASNLWPKFIKNHNH